MHREIRSFSLLTPDESDHCVSLADSTVNDLSLSYLCSCLARNATEEDILLAFLRELPVDYGTIAYRQAVYRDLREDPAFCEQLTETSVILAFGSSLTGCGHWSSTVQRSDRSGLFWRGERSDRRQCRGLHSISMRSMTAAAFQRLLRTSVSSGTTS